MKKNKKMNTSEMLLPPEYRPLSPWGYFWRAVLYSIPVIGLIFLIVNAISGKSRHGRSFARSYFCGLLFAIIVAVVAAVAGFVLAQLGILELAILGL